MKSGAIKRVGQLAPPYRDNDELKNQNEVAWPLFLFCMVGKTRSRWSLAGMTKLQDWDKF